MSRLLPATLLFIRALDRALGLALDRALDRALGRALGFALVLALGACSSRYAAPVDDLDETPRFVDAGRTHRVNDGETLYVVAWMYDLDVNALARANNLREPYTISPGQILSVDLRSASGARPTAVATANPGTATTTAAVVATGIRRTPLESAPITRQALPPAAAASQGALPPSAPAPQGALPPASTPRETAPAPAPSNSEPASVAPRTTTAPTNDGAPASTPPQSSVATAPPSGNTTSAPTPREQAPPVVTTAPVDARPVTEPSAPALPPPVDPNAASPSPSATADQAIRWDWPTRGNIIGRYSDSDPDNKGIKLGGSEGDTVMAAADGEVVYTGNGLLRYGELVILKHNERFLSAYAHNKVIAVKEGERVTLGQKIAELGSTGIDRDMLHFEIRLDGKPVDPMTYLPAR
jgi:lipoprotein NlpD